MSNNMIYGPNHPRTHHTAVKHHPGEGTSLLFEGIVKRGLQFPGAHHPRGAGQRPPYQAAVEGA